MFNLNKFMKIVKNGTILDVVFNVRKKAEDEAVKEFGLLRNIEELDPEMQGDEAAQFLAKQKGTAVPSGIKVQQPTQVLPPDIEEKMNNWINNNKDAVLVNDVSVDFSLYRDIKNNLNYKNILIKKFDEANRSINTEEAAIYIQMMSDKAQNILGQWTPEEIEKLELEGAPSKPAPKIKVENTGVQEVQNHVLQTFAPTELSDAEKISISNYLGWDSIYNYDQLQNAAISVFNPKKSIDDRFNFFLNNSEKLMPIISANRDLEMNLLNAMGESGGDVYSALERAYKGGVKTQGPPIGLLSQEPHGSQILGMLNDLIGSKDRSIVDWFKGSLRSDQKVHSIGLGGDPERSISNEGIEDINQRKDQVLEDVDEKIEADERGLTVEQLRQEKEGEEAEEKIEKQRTMTELSKKMSSVIKYYLKDNLNYMKNFNHDTTLKIMTEYSEKIDDLKQEIALNPKSKDFKSKLIKVFAGYSHADEMNAFVVSAQKQLEDVFDTLGNSEKKQNHVIYENEFGTVSVPISVLQDIFGKDALKGGKDPSKLIENYEQYVDAYKEKIASGEVADPYKPDWSKIVNYRHVYNALADLGRIKGLIRFGAEGKKISDPNKMEEVIDDIYNEIQSDGRLRNKLKELTGITDEEELSPIAQIKKKDYIAKTIEQNPKDVDYAISIFEMRQKYDEERFKFPPKRYDPTNKKATQLMAKGKMRTPEQEKEVEKINKKEKRHNPLINKIRQKQSLMHSMKTRVGDGMVFILPVLAELAQSKSEGSLEEKEAARAYVDLFDHNPVRLHDFLGNSVGRRKNDIDELGRFNTELYHIAKQIPMSSDIKNLIQLHEDKRDWHNEFFNIYDAYNEEGRKAIKQHDLAKNKKLLLEEIEKEEIIPKIAKKVELMLSDKNLIKWHDVLKNVPEEERIEFSNDIKQWNSLGIERPMIPIQYVKYLELKNPYRSWNTMNNVIVDYEKSSIKHKDRAINVRKVLDRILANEGYNFRMTPLKLAYRAYKRMMLKIAKLLTIKQSSYKFASINSASIDDIIIGIKKDFNSLFEKLLR